MTDLTALSDETDTSVEILRAIVDQQGDDEREAILEKLENPEDFDALVAQARTYTEDGSALRWQGRAIA